MSVRTADIKAALQSRYGGEAWALLWSVPDGTGMNKLRTADAIAMSLWPSRGLELHGFELKASRSDWQRELKQPAKAESICRYCDRWWIVAGDKGIVRDDELPPTWGLLVLNGAGLVQVKAAPALTPQPIDRDFLAGLLRSSTKAEAREQSKILAAARQAGYDEGFKAAGKPDNHVQECLDKLTENVRRFEELSGVRITKWHGSDDEARRVKEVLACDRVYRHSRQSLDQILRHATAIKEATEKALQPAP